MKKVLNLNTLNYYELNNLRNKTIKWMDRETKKECEEIVSAIDKTLKKFNQ